LRIIDRFSAVDIDFLNEGLTHLHALTHDARKFPYMVKRSHLSKRVAKPASQKAARPVLPSGHVTPLRRYSSFRVGRESV
jgi:hypothetical protein